MQESLVLIEEEKHGSNEHQERETKPSLSVAAFRSIITINERFHAERRTQGTTMDAEEKEVRSEKTQVWVLALWRSGSHPLLQKTFSPQPLICLSDFQNRVKVCR